jgi:hypothetical protein
LPIDQLGLQITALFETAAPPVTLSELDPAVSTKLKGTNRLRVVIGVAGALAAVVLMAWALGTGPNNRVVTPSAPDWMTVEFPAGAAGVNFGVVVSAGDDIIFWGSQTEGAPETPGAEPGLAYNLESGLWHEISPSPKQAAWGAAGVWTGSEMVITGGAAGSPEEPRTVAYDPRTDTWRMLADPPISGAFTDAVWTGSQMLVVVSDGVAAYDPETDQWHRFPDPPDLGSSGVPFQGPWQVNEVIWTGDELIIWSGDVERTIHRGISLDPVTEEWRMLPDPPAWPAAPSLVWTGDRAVLWGGLPSSSAGSSERAVGSVFEPRGDHWTEMAEPLPEPEGFEGNLGSQSMLWTGDRVLVSTGALGTGVDPDRSLLLSYDPDDNTWEYVGVAPTSAETWGVRSLMAGDRVVLISDRLYLSQPGWVPGGEPVSADTWPTTTTTTVPPATTTSLGTTTTVAEISSDWRQLASPPLSDRIWSSATWTGSELIVWGGATANGSTFSDGAAYDLSEDSWRFLAESPLQPRANYVAIWTGDRLIVWGGASYGTGGQLIDRLDDGASYDPKTDTWAPISSPPLTGGPGYSAVWTGDEVIVLGGNDQSSSYPEAAIGQAAAFNPTTDTWRAMTLPQDLLINDSIWTGSEVVMYGVDFYLGRLIGFAYDPAEDHWRDLPDAPINPPVPDIAFVDGRVLTWTYDPEDQGIAALDLNTQEWLRLPSFPGHATDDIPTAVVIGDNEFLMESENTLGIYSFNSDQWRFLRPPVEVETYGGAPVWTGDEVLIFRAGLAPGDPNLPDGRPAFLWSYRPR